MRVEFKLSMPNVGSWNGKWSGEGKRYALNRTITENQAKLLGLRGGYPNWYHSFGDGWGASISAKILEKGERFQKSNGFCGYDWMVDNILYYGRISACDSTANPHEFHAPDNDGWQTCRKYGCSTRKKVELVKS